MQKTLVIVGGGAEQESAYRLARSAGHRVVCTDASPSAPCVGLADDFLRASTRDPSETVRALERYVQEGGRVDGVMTIANDVPLTVATVAEHFGLPGHTVASARLAADKVLMKDAFRDAGVACPGYWTVDSLDALRDVVHREGLSDFVLKPIDGRGARGVLILRQGDDLAWAWSESSSWSERPVLLVERFVPGLQISSESFLVDGVAYTPALAERNYDRLDQFRPFAIEDGGTIPAPVDETLRERIDRLIEAGAAALGVRDGIVKGDLVVAPDGTPMIIELALRLSGGWFASDQIVAATGVNLVEAVITQALGDAVAPTSLRPTRQRATAIRYWFPSSGRIVSIDGQSEVSASLGVLRWGMFRDVGDMQPVVRSHPDRFGFVLVEGEDRTRAIALLRDAMARLAVVTKPA